MKVFNNPNYEEEVSVDLNLKLDEHMDIIRLIGTEQPDFIQVVFRDTNIEEGEMRVATWDLVKNMEYSLIEYNDLEAQEPYNLICRGMKKKFNYLVTNSYFYDLLY